MRSMRSLLVIACALCTIGVAAGAAAAADPPGNNGTVKVDGSSLVDLGNDAHIGCSLQIDFFGFDQGVPDATVTLDLQPPTGGVEVLSGTASIGGDPAGGGTDSDGSFVVPDLSGPFAATGAAPSPNQGFHVMLTVNAPGSIGATTKHKTFWVDGCGGEGGGGEG
jgi:hypothetical protein